jgi:hypothetical protein
MEHSRTDRRTCVAQTSTYLNFERSCEEAFEFYKQAFGTEYA